MEFKSTPEEREEAICYCLEAIADDFNEMVILIGHSPLILKEANIALRNLTAQLVHLAPFFLFFLLGFDP